jgi:hypothetical protein
LEIVNVVLAALCVPAVMTSHSDRLAVSPPEAEADGLDSPPDGEADGLDPPPEGEADGLDAGDGGAEGFGAAEALGAAVRAALEADEVGMAAPAGGNVQVGGAPPVHAPAATAIATDMRAIRSRGTKESPLRRYGWALDMAALERVLSRRSCSPPARDRLRRRRAVFVGIVLVEERGRRWRCSSQRPGSRPSS